MLDNLVQRYSNYNEYWLMPEIKRIIVPLLYKISVCTYEYALSSQFTSYMLFGNISSKIDIIILQQV